MTINLPMALQPAVDIRPCTGPVEDSTSRVKVRRPRSKAAAQHFQEWLRARLTADDPHTPFSRLAEDLAVSIGLGPRAGRSWASGSSQPSFDALPALAEKLGVHVEEVCRAAGRRAPTQATGMPTLAAKLRQWREREGITAEEAAARAKMHPTRWSRFQSGAATPGPKLLVVLSKATGISLEELATAAGVTLDPQTLARLSRSTGVTFQELTAAAGNAGSSQEHDAANALRRARWQDGRSVEELAQAIGMSEWRVAAVDQSAGRDDHDAVLRLAHELQVPPRAALIDSGWSPEDAERITVAEADTEPRNTLGAFLQSGRKTAGHKLVEAAAKAGMSHSSLLRIERGSVPDVAALERLTHLYGLDIGEAVVRRTAAAMNLRTLSLQQRRREAGLTQEHVAGTLGVPVEALAKIELNATRDDWRLMLDYARAVGLDPLELLQSVGWTAKDATALVAAADTQGPSELHEYLRSLRRAAGLSLEAAAKRMRILAPVLSNYERGWCQPSLGRLERIADAYEYPYIELVVARSRPTQRILMRARDAAGMSLESVARTMKLPRKEARRLERTPARADFRQLIRLAGIVGADPADALTQAGWTTEDAQRLLRETPHHTPNDELGARLRALRERRGLTVAQVCKEIRAQQRTLDGYESGEQTPPVDRLEELAEVYEADLWALLACYWPPADKAMPVTRRRPTASEREAAAVLAAAHVRSATGGTGLRSVPSPANEEGAVRPHIAAVEEAAPAAA